MKKYINLKKLSSFALSSLFCLTFCGDMSATGKKEKKKSSYVLPIVVSLAGIGFAFSIGAGISYCTNGNDKEEKQPPNENPEKGKPDEKSQEDPKPIETPEPVETPKPVKDPKPYLDPVVQNIDITKETKTKLEDIYLWSGDITTLTVDVIVNAAKNSLLGGGGVDGAIHKAAGTELVKECKTLHGCHTGEAKITKGYKLPSKYVIHTVGPIISGALTQKDRDLLASCYKSSLELADKNSLNSIAFCCISTGYYGFPQEEAAKIAIETVKNYKSITNSKIKIIFVVFTGKDGEIYKKMLL